MAKITGVEYDKQELGDILTTAVEGGLMFWCSFNNVDRADDLTIQSIDIEPTEETEGDFPRTVVYQIHLQSAVNAVLSGSVELRSDLVDSIRSGDVGNIDAEGAECLVQIAVLGELMYG